ncbi:MAG: hypothetical protein DWP95_00160 [Proteobacteria bacterium]|nr:MAG: hypothetical protein DWP95_00160 [Pseudomonadota bacterium]
MSSIIDALKKSDAKRPKKNHGLKIRMDLKSHSVKNKRRGFYAFVMVLVLLLILVYFQKPDIIWQQFNRQEPPQLVTETTPDNTSQAAEKIKKLSKPAPAEVQSIVNNQPNETSQSHILSEPEPAADNLNVVIEEKEISHPRQSDKQDLVETSQAATTLPDDQIQQQIDQQLDATPMKNKQVITEAPQNNSNPPDTTANLPQVFELPYAIRKDLPKLNLSVHVYDPVVENRMAILNGVTIHVGDTFEELLTIQDITQSGVVIRIQNRDFVVLK